MRQDKITLQWIRIIGFRMERIRLKSIFGELNQWHEENKRNKTQIRSNWNNTNSNRLSTAGDN